MSYKSSKTFILAEVACSHDGEPERIKKIIDATSESGADGIQFQFFSTSDLVTPDFPYYSKLMQLNISEETWSNMVPYAKQKGLQVWANIFDTNRLELAYKLDVDRIKIHSTDLSNNMLLREAARCNKPISLAIGGSMIDEISNAVCFLKTHGVTDLLLMHGFQAFPTPPEENHLRLIETLKQMFDCPVGYQDHTDGSSELALILPVVAIGAGASVIEKHVTDDRERKGTDYQAALGPEEFKKMVNLIRQIDISLGSSSIHPLSQAELQYRKTMKKSIVAARDIEHGEIITLDMLKFMRSSSQGLPPSETDRLIGKKTCSLVKKYQPVTENFIVNDSEADKTFMEVNV